MRIDKYNIVIAVCLVLLAAIWLPYLSRAFVSDSFNIKGTSMLPTFEQGRKIRVNKLIFGARIYKRYDFSTSEMKCFRMPGIRRLRPGDVLVFNYPYGWTEDTIGFKINYVYAKRCVACPGDSISIRDGFYVNSRCADVRVPDTFQTVLRNMSDSLLRDAGVVVRAGGFTRGTGWTIKDFGPLYIPGRGDSLTLDKTNARLYGKLIKYETGSFPVADSNSVYVFRENYYFLAGDNVIDSRDSRYFGLVPEDFIVGVVKRYSHNPTGK